MTKKIFVCSASRKNGCDGSPCIMVLPGDVVPDDQCMFESIRNDLNPPVTWRQDIDPTPPDWYKEMAK